MTPKQQMLIENKVRKIVKSVMKEESNPQNEVLGKNLVKKLLDLATEFEKFNHNSSDEFWNTRGDIYEEWIIDALKKIYSAFGVGNKFDKDFARQLFKK